MRRLATVTFEQHEARPRTLILPEHIHRSAFLTATPGVVHGITRRVPGAGVADGNVGYSVPRDRTDAWAMRREWMLAAGLDVKRIAVASQHHGAIVTVVGRADAGRGADPESRGIGEADAIVVAEPGVVAMTLHADCMPILICDPVRRAIATIHAGWRGTALDIAGETVRRFQSEFGSKPEDMVAYLGPAIGGCCYEVGADVAEAWSAIEEDGGALRPLGAKWTFDLEAANRQLLARAGLGPHRIEASGVCTKCDGHEWFSHRGQGPHTGRYGAFVALIDD